MQIAFPFRIDGRGRTATVDEDRHVLELIEQIVFTGVGERVNRPTFGSGILQLLFAGNSPELAQATEYLLRGQLQQYLGDRIDIDALTALAEDNVLRIAVTYRLKGREEQRIAEFAR